MMRRLNDQRGVALITVLLIGAALTAVTSVAAFATIREFRQNVDDRKATEALAYAEAGIDRFIDYIRSSGRVGYNNLKTAGCDGKLPLELPEGSIGNGSFKATLMVFDPNATGDNRFPPAACSARPANARDTSYYVITSTGTHPAAKRVVQQVIGVTAAGLPIGVYAKAINATGTPQMVGVTMISETTIIGREKLVFNGDDPYYTLDDFWPNNTWPTGRSGSDRMPSSAHAVTGIYLKTNATNPEFPHPVTGMINCEANGSGGQSLWDGDGANGGLNTSNLGCAGQVGYPPRSSFTSADLKRIAEKGGGELTPQDFQILRQGAKDGGIYCSIGATAATTSCTLLGQPIPYASTWQDGEIAPLYSANVKNFIGFFEFTTGTPTSNELNWKADVWPCNSDPEIAKSGVLIVRNGGMSVQNGADINGALIMDGDFKYDGTVVINGTIISKNTVNITGTSTFSMDQCWIDNMPGPFLSVSPVHWAEIDR